MNSAIKYPGGQYYIAKTIVSLQPKDYITYCEPYFGSGAVLFENEYDGISEVVNDLDGELTNFWQVLQQDSTFEKFKRLCEATPFSKPEFDLAYHKLNDPILSAWQFFIRCRQSRSGQQKNFATLTKNRTRKKMNEQVSAWISSIEYLPQVHNRLKRVLILNEHAADVITRMDCKNTFFNLDPPFLHETRQSKKLYQHEMSKEEHEGLLKLLCQIEGKFILAGYYSDLYNDYAIPNGWNRTDINIDNKMSSSRNNEVLCLWRNYD